MRDFGFKTLDSNSSNSDIFYNINPTKEVPITLAKPTGATELKRGTVLGITTSNGKAGQYDSASSTGLQNIAGVLGETITFGSNTDELTFMYVDGEFLWEALSAKDGVTIPVGLINNGLMTFKKGASSD